MLKKFIPYAQALSCETRPLSAHPECFLQSKKCIEGESGHENLLFHLTNSENASFRFLLRYTAIAALRKSGLGFILLLGAFNGISAITISDTDARIIGQKIWKNECGGTIQGLTSWNQGEEFASLGIGHFIWCHENHKNFCPFSETFPSLLAFIKNKGRALPSWLSPYMSCIWKSRKAFLEETHSSRMKELRQFLVDTVDLQTEFILQRLEAALPSMLKKSPIKLHAHIKKQFSLLEKTPQGVYALIDYVNFKGEGINPKEQYQNKGWGLLQILERMKASTSSEALYEFASAAKIILTERVQHSPPGRNEKQWLPGWKNRIDTYLHA